MSRRRVVPISREPQPGVVYGIRSVRGGPIKVGWVASPLGLPARVGALQIGNPEELQVVWTMPGSVFDERDVHYAFRDLRIRGEWFDVEVADLERYAERKAA